MTSSALVLQSTLAYNFILQVVSPHLKDIYTEFSLLDNIYRCESTTSLFKWKIITLTFPLNNICSHRFLIDKPGKVCWWMRMPGCTHCFNSFTDLILILNPRYTRLIIGQILTKRLKKYKIIK